MMTDTRRELIHDKNEAYLHLADAELRCAKRLHTAGWLPGTWIERLAVVRAEYRAAREAWQRGQGT